MNKVEIDLSLIIDEYSNYVYKIIDNIACKSLSFQDKEEIISDTFYLLWKNQSHIDKNLKAYLSAIARNCTYKKLKNIKTTVDFDESQNIIVENTDRLLAIKERLDALNETEKEIFELYYVCGLKIKEIASLTNRTLGSTKMILLRIRKKFKEDF